MNLYAQLRDNLLHESDRWALWTPLPVAIGIIIYFALPFEPSLYVLLATPALALVCWIIRHKFIFFLPCFTALLLMLGFNAAEIETKTSYTPMLDREQGPLPITGRLMFTEVMPNGMRLTLKDLEIGHMKPEETPVKIRIKMNNKELEDIPPPGARIKLFAQISPFSEPVVPGATDFRRQSYFKRLGGLGWSYSHIDIVDANPPATSWRDEFWLMFEHARVTLAEHVYARLSGDVAAMTVTRMNGEQAAISEPVIEAMRVAGLAHLLSTSGFHVTIMGLLVYFPLRAMLALIPWIALRWPIKKIAAAGAIFSTLGYTFLVGSQAATLRSMLMCGIAMIAVIANRRSVPMRLVMLSAFLAMLMTPSAALGPSFQMSFAAVFCLIASHGKKLHWIVTPDSKVKHAGWVKSVIDHFGSIVTTSLIATAATTPFTLYHFQAFNIYGFVANTLAIPMTSFWVMPCILMAYILVPFNLDGWFLDAAGAGIDLTIKIALEVTSWPFSIIYLPAMPWQALAAASFGGLWLCIWKRSWRWWGLIPIFISCFYPLYTPKPDVMIAPNGKVWAARLDDGRLAVSNLDRDTFIYTQWQQRLGMPELVDVFELQDNSMAEARLREGGEATVPQSSRAQNNQLRCDNAGCIYNLGTHKIAFPELNGAALEDCEMADVVIAPFVIKDCSSAQSSRAKIIDEPEFWFHGSHAIYKNGDGLRIEEDRPRRALRPWSVGWTYKLRKEATLGARDDD